MFMHRRAPTQFPFSIKNYLEVPKRLLLAVAEQTLNNLWAKTEIVQEALIGLQLFLVEK